MASNHKYLSENIFSISMPDKEIWEINRFTLSFIGNAKQHESEFRDAFFRNSIKLFRLSILLGIFFYSIFSVLDTVLFPELKNTFLIIRFGVMVPVLTFIFIATYINPFKKLMQYIASIAMYSSSLGIIIMVVLTAKSANHYSYYAGIILILFFGYSFSRIRFIYGFITGWLIILSYEIGAIWLTQTPSKILINNNFFFISSNIIGMLISYYLEYSSRWNFYLQVLLENEREKVIEANDNLEKRVLEKTGLLIGANNKLKKEIAIGNKYKNEKATLEAQLFQLHKMETIGTLAGGIAHDFNNILTPIIGYAGMALDELPQDSPIKEDIEQINNAASKGKELIHKILTFSRQIDHDKKPLQLYSIINEVIDMLKVTMPSNIEVKRVLDPHSGTILADKVQMHQVIMNLAVNSYHAMKEKGGTLDIKLSTQYFEKDKLRAYKKLKKGNYVMLTIKDAGHGMSHQTKSRIFEPFFTNKEVGEGTGLGLSVVHGIIKNHDGFITVDSEPGNGTTFNIYLPQLDEKDINMEDKELVI